MKILAFADSHGKIAAAESIVGLARDEKPDVLLCAGDFSFFGEQYVDFLQRLQSLGAPVWYVSGNHEPEYICGHIETRFPFMRNVAFRTVDVGGVRLAGVPGTQEFRPDARDDAETFNLAMRLWGTLDRAKPLVFLSHYPPRGTAIDGTKDLTYDSGGSRLLRRIVEALKPAIVICGHYHSEAGNRAHVGSTLIVNPGPNGLILSV